MITPPFASLFQRFFTDRLGTQMEASPNTIAGYRDTFRLLLRFAAEKLGKTPTKLQMEEVDVNLIGDFLTHVETVRHNSARSRNTRLAAIRSFFGYVAMNEPSYLLHCQRILAMPGKRYVRRVVDFLDRPQMDALLAAPNLSTWISRRDHTILLVALRTGLRVSEIVNLRWQNIIFGTGAHVSCEGKGRKQRCTPIRRDSLAALEAWFRERAGAADDPVFPTIRGDKMSRDALERVVRKYAKASCLACPSMAGKRVSPHVLRHSTAMELLQNGVDQTVIALWLGHESVETTQIYVHADLRLKEKALARVTSKDSPPGRYRPEDDLLAFLESL